MIPSLSILILMLRWFVKYRNKSVSFLGSETGIGHPESFEEFLLIRIR